MLNAGERLSTAVDDCMSVAIWARSDQELVDALLVQHAAVQRLSAQCAHLVRELEARGLPAAQHAANTAVWLRDQLRVSVSAGKRLAELGRCLATHPALDQAVSDGVAGVEQATVIGQVLDSLPAEVGPATVAKAEAALVDMAGQFEPKALRILGRRVLSHVDPDAGQRAEAAILERQAERAHQQRTLTLCPAGQGRIRLTGWLDAEAAAIISAALDPLCRPLPDDERCPGQRRADALAEVCQLALHAQTLPDNGGDRPHVVVTIGLDQLRAQLGSAQLDTGEQLTPAQARRMACDAQLIPAVLGGQGQVLDLGQSRRVFTGSLRRALILRDGGCAYPGCDRPATWCQSHHINRWVDGGATTLDNGLLLCGHHHRQVHEGGWTVRMGADRLPEFVPPAHVDPTGTPRRNIYHRPHRTVIHHRT